MSNLLQDVSFDFSHRRVLVTGATAGIGLGIATLFQQNGAEVIVTGTRPTAADYTVELSAFQYRQLDVTSPASIAELAQGIDALDILVNNAGGTGQLPEDFEQALALNLLSVQRMTMAMWPKLHARKNSTWGNIVNIGSMVSNYATSYYPGYGASKAAVTQMTKTYANLLAPHRIRVNCILSGSVMTRMTEPYLANAESVNLIADKTSMRRWASPEELAGPVLLLCSSAASFVTGAALLVDGGYSLLDLPYDRASPPPDWLLPE